MGKENIITLLNEEFENSTTGEKVRGITVIVDGNLKQMFDLILIRSDSYKDYTEIIKEAIFSGIDCIIKKLN